MVPAVVRKKGPHAAPLGKVERRPRVELDAPLATVCGGALLERGAVLVTGPAGAGKSTEAARVLVELDALGWTHLVVDSEMLEDLCAETFERAGAKPDLLQRIMRVQGAQSWDDAIAVIRREGPDVVLVDSLDAWANYAEARRKEILADLTHPEHGLARDCLVIVIAQWARKGHVRGSTVADHGCDAVIVVRTGTLAQRKCRWAPPKVIRRSAPARKRRAAQPPPRSRAARRPG